MTTTTWRILWIPSRGASVRAAGPPRRVTPPVAAAAATAAATSVRASAADLRKQRQFGLALAAQHLERHLDARDAARLRERSRLRPHRLRRQDPAAVALRGVDADEVQVA